MAEHLTMDKLQVEAGADVKCREEETGLKGGKEDLQTGPSRTQRPF